MNRLLFLSFFFLVSTPFLFVSPLPLEETDDGAEDTEVEEDTPTSPPILLTTETTQLSTESRVSAQELYLRSLDLGNISQECQVQLRKTDSCLTNIMFLSDDDKVQIPSTIQDIDAYCG